MKPVAPLAAFGPADKQACVLYGFRFAFNLVSYTLMITHTDFLLLRLQGRARAFQLRPQQPKELRRSFRDLHL